MIEPSQNEVEKFIGDLVKFYSIMSPGQAKRAFKAFFECSKIDFRAAQRMVKTFYNISANSSPFVRLNIFREPIRRLEADLQTPKTVRTSQQTREALERTLKERPEGFSAPKNVAVKYDHWQEAAWDR